MSVSETKDEELHDVVPAAPAPLLEHTPDGAEGKPSGRRWLLLGGCTAVVVIALTAAVMVIARAGGPTLADAQRECKTAFVQEFQRRIDRADAGSSPVVASLTGVDLDESREVDGGFEVNGTVRYTLTAVLVGTVPNTLMFTCIAKVADNALVTTVRNRT